MEEEGWEGRESVCGKNERLEVLGTDPVRPAWMLAAFGPSPLGVFLRSDNAQPLPSAALRSSLAFEPYPADPVDPRPPSCGFAL